MLRPLKPRMGRYHLFFVACFLYVPCVLSELIASIDCGYSGKEYLDSKLIIWESDDDYIRNGDSKVVPSRNSVSTEMDTLRVFTTRKKNCYGINSVDQEGERILIRASFYYGNYDGKSSPPVFDLQFSGNEWSTVQTSMDTVISHEVIYVVQGYTPSVCVAQTKPGNFPFISAIEVRILDSEMYSGIRQDRALFLRDRIAYGSDEIIRYADDSFDRLWIPGGGTGFLSVANEAIFIDATHDDYPPVKVLDNAITQSSEFGNITLSSFPTNTDSNKQSLVYLNLYFSEVRELDETTELRSFNIYIDDNLWTQESPVKPPYEDFHQYYGNITVTSNSTVKLVRTSDSTLPPLINALEWFFISDVLNNGTDSKDADGLYALQEAFEVLQDWQGDPCLPASFSWDWITCSSDPIPRVTALDVSGFNLSGTLPDFSTMDALETIDLHNNSIEGPIPDFLGQLPNLKQLDLSKNELSGAIPSSLSSNKIIKLDVSGNPGLCSSGKSCKNPPSPGDGSSSGRKKKKKGNLPLILGITIPMFLLFWIVAGMFLILHIKRRNISVTATIPGQESGGNEPKQEPEEPLSHGRESSV